MCAFLKSHCRVERYHVEIFKCCEVTCTVCKAVRMPGAEWSEVISCPRLVPLPTPSSGLEKDATGSITYCAYDDIKRLETHPKHRPSYNPPKEASKEAKTIDQNLRTEILSTIWAVKNVRLFVRCEDCLRARLVFSPPLQNAADSMSARVRELEGVLSEPSYEYMCGDSLFGLKEEPVPHPESTDIFHVKRALTCGMGIEKPYFSCKKFPAICAHCGSGDDHVPDDEIRTTDGKKAYPLCRTCHENNKKPITYGQATKVGAGKRKQRE
jgi:hypothetical protein